MNKVILTSNNCDYCFYLNYKFKNSKSLCCDMNLAHITFLSLSRRNFTTELFCSFQNINNRKNERHRLIGLFGL